jgi:hypothetical protein
MSTIGGSADTEEKALMVRPNRPPDPSVVTTLTPVAAPRIALMKSWVAMDSIARLMPANSLIGLLRFAVNGGISDAASLNK